MIPRKGSAEAAQPTCLSSGLCHLVENVTVEQHCMPSPWLVLFTAVVCAAIKDWF